MAWLADSIDEHLQALQQLLKKEKEADLLQKQESIASKDIKTRITEGLTWHPLIIKDWYYDAKEYIVLELEKTHDFETPSSFSYGAQVELFATNAYFQKGDEIKGQIAHVTFKSVVVNTRLNELPDWFNNGKLGINLLLDDYTYKVMNEGLDAVIHAKSNSRLYDLKQAIFKNDQSLHRDEITPTSFQHLNTNQAKSVVEAIQAKYFSIIQGPPGTGKTTSIVALVKEIQKTTSKPVLVVAPSNQAVDYLAIKLKAESLNVIRLGQIFKLSEEVLSVALSELILKSSDYKLVKDLRARSKVMKDMASKYKRNFGKEEREQRNLLRKEASSLYKESLQQEQNISDVLLNKANVICTTLVGTNLPAIRERHFEYVIIDEAAQALEPSTWLVISKADKVILCGDHFQLPPTVKLDMQNGGKELMKTLMERVLEDEVSSHLLTEQYRMHDVIKEFSNQKFYHGKLSTPTLVQAQRDQEQPILFIDTAGCGYEEENDPSSQSLMNKGEIEITQKLIQHYSLEGQWKNYQSLGIISPYSAQVKHLKTSIKEVENLQTKISTIDAYQGQEADVIIISLVRNNEQGEIGFLNDYRRMNVALTRAKQQLIIIGDSSTITKHKFYADLFNFIENHNGYKSAYEFLYD
jgi:ATP-dependent RNA/DNA helicase IGHMBP2